jgi:hypothetical protein
MAALKRSRRFLPRPQENRNLPFGFVVDGDIMRLAAGK